MSAQLQEYYCTSQRLLFKTLAELFTKFVRYDQKETHQTLKVDFPHKCILRGYEYLRKQLLTWGEGSTGEKKSDKAMLLTRSLF